MLMFNGIIAIICTALITWNWIHYYNQYKKNRERVKRKNRKMIWLLPAMIAAFILGITAVIAVTALFPEWVLPDNYLFFEHGPITGMVLVLLIILPTILFCVSVVAKIRKKSVEEMEDVNDLLFI